MRQAKPYFKASHQAWYVNLHGKPQRLGTEEDAAWKEYHRLMAGEAPATPKITVAALLEQFLTWTKANRSPRTHEWHCDHLGSFARYVGVKRKVADLKPYDGTRWLEKCYKSSGNAHKNGACQSINRAFNWAKQQGLIAANPLTGMEKPPREPREAYLSGENWERLIARVDGEPIADLFRFMRETGCRPLEARMVEARHWEKTNELMKLELALTKGRKGKKLPRIIRLNEPATAIVARLALKNPTGPLFLNRLGRPWTNQALICRCADLSDELDFELFPYILRHTFCTDALLRGVDPITVAHLMGHKDASMVMKVYSHLIHQSDHLKEKLRQATGA